MVYLGSAKSPEEFKAAVEEGEPTWRAFDNLKMDLSLEKLFLEVVDQDTVWCSEHEVFVSSLLGRIKKKDEASQLAARIFTETHSETVAEIDPVSELETLVQKGMPLSIQHLLTMRPEIVLNVGQIEKLVTCIVDGDNSNEEKRVEILRVLVNFLPEPYQKKVANQFLKMEITPTNIGLFNRTALLDEKETVSKIISLASPKLRERCHNKELLSALIHRYKELWVELVQEMPDALILSMIDCDDKVDGLLHQIILEGDVKTIRSIFERCPQEEKFFTNLYRQKTKYGETLLHLACKNGDLEVIQLIHEYCPKTLWADQFVGGSVLSLLTQKGSVDSAHWVFENCPRRSKPDLFQGQVLANAIYTGKTEWVRFVLEHCPSRQMEQLLSEKPITGDTPIRYLVYSAAKGETQDYKGMLKVLFEKTPHPLYPLLLEPDEFGNSALYRAIQEESFGVAKALLELCPLEAFDLLTDPISEAYFPWDPLHYKSSTDPKEYEEYKKQLLSLIFEEIPQEKSDIIARKVPDKHIEWYLSAHSIKKTKSEALKDRCKSYVKSIVQVGLPVSWKLPENRFMELFKEFLSLASIEELKNDDKGGVNLLGYSIAQFPSFLLDERDITEIKELLCSDAFRSTDEYSKRDVLTRVFDWLPPNQIRSVLYLEYAPGEKIIDWFVSCGWGSVLRTISQKAPKKLINDISNLLKDEDLEQVGLNCELEELGKIYFPKEQLFQVKAYFHNSELIREDEESNECRAFIKELASNPDKIESLHFEHHNYLLHTAFEKLSPSQKLELLKNSTSLWGYLNVERIEDLLPQIAQKFDVLKIPNRSIRLRIYPLLAEEKYIIPVQVLHLSDCLMGNPSDGASIQVVLDKLMENLEESVVELAKDLKVVDFIKSTGEQGRIQKFIESKKDLSLSEKEGLFPFLTPDHIHDFVVNLPVERIDAVTTEPLRSLDELTVVELAIMAWKKPEWVIPKLQDLSAQNKIFAVMPLLKLDSKTLGDMSQFKLKNISSMVREEGRVRIRVWEIRECLVFGKEESMQLLGKLLEEPQKHIPQIVQDPLVADEVPKEMLDQFLQVKGGYEGLSQQEREELIYLFTPDQIYDVVNNISDERASEVVRSGSPQSHFTPLEIALLASKESKRAFRWNLNLKMIGPFLSSNDLISCIKQHPDVVKHLREAQKKQADFCVLIVKTLLEQDKMAEASKELAKLLENPGETFPSIVKKPIVLSHVMEGMGDVIVNYINGKGGFSRLSDQDKQNLLPFGTPSEIADVVRYTESADEVLSKVLEFDQQPGTPVMLFTRFANLNIPEGMDLEGVYPVCKEFLAKFTPFEVALVAREAPLVMERYIPFLEHHLASVVPVLTTDVLEKHLSDRVVMYAQDSQKRTLLEKTDLLQIDREVKEGTCEVRFLRIWIMNIDGVQKKLKRLAFAFAAVDGKTKARDPVSMELQGRLTEKYTAAVRTLDGIIFRAKAKIEKYEKEEVDYPPEYVDIAFQTPFEYPYRIPTAHQKEGTMSTVTRYLEEATIEALLRLGEGEKIRPNMVFTSPYDTLRINTNDCTPDPEFAKEVARYTEMEKTSFVDSTVEEPYKKLLEIATSFGPIEVDESLGEKLGVEPGTYGPKEKPYKQVFYTRLNEKFTEALEELASKKRVAKDGAGPSNVKRRKKSE